ncbi:MAG TPA: hypothetical protein VFW07_03930 [Parafilimonas sp.]|nr:hypothetical protein [Parafilimonas sp.]
MKQIFFAFALISLDLSGTAQSFSQVALHKYENATSTSISLITDASVTNNTAVIFNLKTVASSIKVQRSFITYFGENAENNWSIVGKYFLNRFHSNGLLINALFTKNGRLIYTITYGTEKNLPADIRKIVKREYYDYTITMAIEVKENGRDIWVIKLDSPSEQMTVRVEDHEMEQVLQFDKAN